MASSDFSSITEQVTSHLRQELAKGRWLTTVPGRNNLAAELGVSHKTVESALQNLEAEGLLTGQGAGRRRLITSSSKLASARPMRVALLLSEAVDRNTYYVVQLDRELSEAGHTVVYPARSLLALGMDVSRIAPLVESTEADVWVIGAASQSVLQWFAANSTPAFALFGRREGLPIAGAGPDKVSAFIMVTRELINLGHRRITLLARPRRRLPEPGTTEQAFLDELKEQGLSAGNFNLPEWDDCKEGLQACLSSLFQLTPPTALICDQPVIFNAVLQFAAARGLRVPGDISIICSDADPTFAWSEPSVAHIRWDPQPIIRRIVAWAANISRGKTDCRQSLTKAEFIEGGTMGPVPRSLMAQ